MKNEVTMSGYQRAVLETLPYLAMLELSSTVSGKKVQIAVDRTEQDKDNFHEAEAALLYFTQCSASSLRKQ